MQFPGCSYLVQSSELWHSGHVVSGLLSALWLRLAGAPQVEQHMVGGEEKTLLVHRKGSTRAFPPHHPLIPVDYQLTGQPVLIGGTMGTHSYVLTGAHALLMCYPWQPSFYIMRAGCLKMCLAIRGSIGRG